MTRIVLCASLLAACASSRLVLRQTDVSPADSRELARTADAEVHREDPEKGPPAAAALAKEHGGGVSAMNGERVTLRGTNQELDRGIHALPSLGGVTRRRGGA